MTTSEDENKSSLGGTIAKVLGGCIALAAGAAGLATLGFLVVLLAGNAMLGSPPSNIDASFSGSVGGTVVPDAGQGNGERLNGEGAVLFQKWVSERTGASMNPYKILRYNLDYHVIGAYGYELAMYVDAPKGYGDYSMRLDGNTFIWRESGAAFAQIRSADFTAEEFYQALEPHIAVPQIE